MHLLKIALILVFIGSASKLDAKNDYYSVLGVEKTATKREVHKAYRKLSAKLHPDYNKDEEAIVLLKKVIEAYKVLGDDEKRARYDSFGFGKKQKAQPEPRKPEPKQSEPKKKDLSYAEKIMSEIENDSRSRAQPWNVFAVKLKSELTWLEKSTFENGKKQFFVDNFNHLLTLFYQRYSRYENSAAKLRVLSYLVEYDGIARNQFQNTLDAYALGIAKRSSSRASFLKAFGLFLLSNEDRLNASKMGKKVKQFADLYSNEGMGVDSLSIIEDCIRYQVFRDIGAGSKFDSLSIGFLRNISGLLDTVAPERALRVLMGINAYERQFKYSGVFEDLKNDVQRLLSSDPSIVQRATEANQGFFARILSGRIFGAEKVSDCDKQFFAWALAQ